MSLEKTHIHQCCDAEPVWIFTYSDGSVFLICKNDVKNPVYHVDLKEIINIATQESFTLEQITGGSKNGN